MDSFKIYSVLLIYTSCLRFLLSLEEISSELGDSTVLVCSLPRQYPSRKLLWYKDNKKVNLDKKRVRSDQNSGNLFIDSLKHSDAGTYFCKSDIGESDLLQLVVNVKPTFVKPPEDKTVLAGEDVLFECIVKGKPSPVIIWKRREGSVPSGRTKVTESTALLIKKVMTSDEGEYVCEGRNSIGSVEAIAMLTVHSRPSFLVTPKDVRVGLNEVATFECRTTGKPMPAVYWTREGSQVLMFPGQPHGRFFVSTDGELKISGVQIEDQGFYVCSALSVAGNTIAKAYLEVLSSVKSLSPPPIILRGPSNQTLAVNSVANIPCTATGNPKPTILWYKDASSLVLGPEVRFSLQQNGNLQIQDLKKADTGIYTCIASNDAGSTSWSATLSVEYPTNPDVIFYRIPQASTLPGPPGKPEFVNKTSSEVWLKWRLTSLHGSSQIIGYMIEYYSKDSESGWIVCARRISDNQYIVKNLKPFTTYVFIIRAENSYGVGFPSAISDSITTKRDLSSQKLLNFDLAQVQEKLSESIVNLREGRALSSTSIKIRWQVLKYLEYVQGFYVKYRSSGSLSNAEYHTITLMQNDKFEFVVTKLEKFHEYTFLVTPFYDAIEGSPSNILTLQTFQDVPSASPANVRAQLLSLTSVVVGWAAPLKAHQNGLLQGYNLVCLDSNELNVAYGHLNVTVNSSITSLTLFNLTQGALYKIQVASFTSKGLGPYSLPLYVHLDASQLPHSSVNPVSTTFASKLRKPWFIALLGASIWLIILVLGVVIYKKLKYRKKVPSEQYIYKPRTAYNQASSNNKAMNSNVQDILWIDNQGWPVQSEHPHSTLFGHPCCVIGNPINAIQQNKGSNMMNNHQGDVYCCSTCTSNNNNCHTHNSRVSNVPIYETPLYPNENYHSGYYTKNKCNHHSGSIHNHIHSSAVPDQLHNEHCHLAFYDSANPHNNSNGLYATTTLINSNASTNNICYCRHQNLHHYHDPYHEFSQTNQMGNKGNNNGGMQTSQTKPSHYFLNEENKSNLLLGSLTSLNCAQNLNGECSKKNEVDHNLIFENENCMHPTENKNNNNDSNPPPSSCVRNNQNVFRLSQVILPPPPPLPTNVYTGASSNLPPFNFYPSSKRILPQTTRDNNFLENNQHLPFEHLILNAENNYTPSNVENNEHYSAKASKELFNDSSCQNISII